MASKRDLERRLSAVADFEEPRLDLEQYPTPARLAADLVHFAGLQGDLAGRTVVDLGAGTGILALGAALRGADRVVGLELDRGAVAVARRNERAVAPPVEVVWIRADATHPPLCPAEPVTVVANPPFGAQRDNVHADRAFLGAAVDLAAVSYSIHNADSEAFVRAFAGDNGGTVTHAFASTVALARRFAHHAEANREHSVEVFRIDWE